MAAKEADEAKAAAESAKAEGAQGGKKEDATPQLSLLAPPRAPEEGEGTA